MPASDDTSDGIRGCYLLQGDPEGKLQFQQLIENSFLTMQATLAEIRTVYSTNPNVLHYWETFFAKYLPPPTEDIQSYLLHLRSNFMPVNVPLRALLEDPIIKVNPEWLEKAPLQYKTAQEYMDWPEILMAATNSVRMSSNRHPPEPRLALPTNIELMRCRDAYALATTLYYSEALKAKTNNALMQDIARHKIGYDVLPIINNGGPCARVCFLYWYYYCVINFVFYMISYKITDYKENSARRHKSCHVI